MLRYILDLVKYEIDLIKYTSRYKNRKKTEIKFR